MNGGDVENMPQSAEAELADAWVVQAWKMWINGLHNWSAIAREVQKDRETVKRNVVKYGRTLAELLLSRKPNALAEYVEGCLEDLAFNMQIALRAAQGERPSKDNPNGTPPNPQLAIAARKEVSARRRDIAEALGLVGPMRGPAFQANFVMTSSDNGANGMLTPQVVRFMLAREDLDEKEFLQLPERAVPPVDEEPPSEQ